MVKAVDVDKDIRMIAEKVGVAVFSYDEIHNKNIDNEFHYDYQRVIQDVSKAQKITPDEAEAALSKSGVLKLLPNGEYEVNVGESTKGGGGINYGSVFFSITSKDYTTKYHELAHSLQTQYGLFGSEKINEVYNVSERGLQSEKEKDEKLATKTEYSSYLNEMHSEAFAYAAMMLRAESGLDFAWQASRSYNVGVNNNFAAVLSFGKTEYGGSENNTKFYATKPIMKETIKAIYKIRKSGEKESFFNKDGTINDEKLALLCEDIVIKKGYSPRTLKSFFNYNITDGHTKEEHGWRKDALKSVVQAPLAVFSVGFQQGAAEKIRSVFKHKALVSEQNKKTKKFLKQKVVANNPELKALKEFEKLQIQMSFIDKKFPEKNLAHHLSKSLPTICQYDMPDSAIRGMTKNITDKGSEAKGIAKEWKNVRETIRENKNNPYFEKLLNSDISQESLHRMIADKQKNPQKEVITTEGLKQRNIPNEMVTVPIKTKITEIYNFTNKYSGKGVTKLELMRMMQNPAMIDNKVIRDSMLSRGQFSNDTLGFKKRKFKKELNQLLDGISASYSNNCSNPKYMEALKEVGAVDVKDAPAKIAEMNAKEREDRRNAKLAANDTKSSQLVAEAKAPEALKSPREEVNAEMQKLGISKESYMLFTPDDKNLKTEYGDSGLPINRYFENKESVEKSGCDKVMGKNNGMTAVYFAKHDVYLVTANPEVPNKMQRAGCSDVGLGVMFSNGEKIMNDTAKQSEWQSVKSVGEEVAQQKIKEASAKNENPMGQEAKPALEEKTVLPAKVNEEAAPAKVQENISAVTIESEKKIDSAAPSIKEVNIVSSDKPIEKKKEVKEVSTKKLGRQIMSLRGIFSRKPKAVVQKTSQNQMSGEVLKHHLANKSK